MGCKPSPVRASANEPRGAEHAPQPQAQQQPKHSYTFATNDRQREQFRTISTIPRLAELDQPQNIPAYTEAPVTETLYPIIDAHDVIIVAGAFFGDEGKGKTIDAIARHPKCVIVARTNSGENAGHTVFDETGKKFVFHLAPSGLLLKDKINLIGPECVMDPISFVQGEVQKLIDAGITDYKNRLFVGNVHIVTPYHKLLDMLLSPVNSSTLKGMSPVHASKVTKRGIRLDHIFNDVAIMKRRLQRDLDTYLAVLKFQGLTDDDVVQRCSRENNDGVKRIPDYVVDFARAQDKVSYLVELYNTHVRFNDKFPQRCDVAHRIRSVLREGGKVLLEGPQSYWLSNARDKFWESSTSADTSAAGLVATAQYDFQRYRTVVINIHKSPGSSRVGIGANPSAYVPQDYFSAQEIRTLRDLAPDVCTDFKSIQRAWCAAVQSNGLVAPLEYTDASGTYNIGVAMAIVSSRHHGESGATTQKPRVTGLFDCVAHAEVADTQGPYLSISALDRGDDYESVGITIAYIYAGPDVQCNGVTYRSGSIIKAGDPYPSEAALGHCYPIVKLVRGWSDCPIAANKRTPGSPLPQGVCEFIAAVEHFSKSRVISIGNGPIGSNIIYLKRN